MNKDIFTPHSGSLHALTEWFADYNFLPLLGGLFIVTGIFFVMVSLINVLRKKLISRARTRKQRTNVELFTKFLKYFLFFFLLLVLTLWNIGSIKELGFALGVISVALGFALQRPITGVVAWLVFIVRKPFQIGDRVVIGAMKGNVVDISISHIYLEEVGRFGGEEVSGRIIIIPNSFLFEKEIVNYSLKNDYVLGQVSFTITFESNIDSAVEVALSAAREHAEEYLKEVEKDAHYRLMFVAHGVEIHVRYYSPFPLAQEVNTDITKTILERIRSKSDVELSYPHTKVLFKENENQDRTAK